MQCSTSHVLSGIVAFGIAATSLSDAPPIAVAAEPAGLQTKKPTSTTVDGTVRIRRDQFPYDLKTFVHGVAMRANAPRGRAFAKDVADRVVAGMNIHEPTLELRVLQTGACSQKNGPSKALTVSARVTGVGNGTFKATTPEERDGMFKMRIALQMDYGVGASAYTLPQLHDRARELARFGPRHSRSTSVMPGQCQCRRVPGELDRV